MMEKSNEAGADIEQPQQQHPKDSLRTPLLPQSRPDQTEREDDDQQQPASNLRLRPRIPNDGGNDHTTRILDRDAEFHQSRGRWGIQRLPRRHRQDLNCCRRWHQRIWKEWVKGDWFHRLAYMRTMPLLTLLFLVYFAIVVFFAFVYLATSQLGKQITTNPDGSSKIVPFCDMDVNDHMEALYFSLSTMTTIGYGVSDYYFGGCWTPLLLVLWQVCTAILFDAVAVGLIFHRISRGRKRGKTITFSDKAVIRRVKGVPYLMFQLGELRKYSLIEANLRVYCVRHERHPIPRRSPRQHTEQPLPPSASQLESRSQDPLPSNITQSRSRPQDLQTPAAPRDLESLPPPPAMEDIDIETTHFITRQVRLLNPDESYGNHILMSLPQVVVHRLDRKSPLMSPQPIWYDENGAAHPGTSDFANLQAFLHDRLAEIVVLVEGTDEGTGAAVQARHSYTVHDLAWNKTFVSCIQPYNPESSASWGFRGHSSSPSNRNSHQTTSATVDFSKFHDISDAPVDCDSCAYVPQE